MDHLTSLGVILLLALAAGHLMKVLRVPEVTGYILGGVVLGPSLLGWLHEDNLIALGVLSEVALGLILFSVGAAFEFSRFERIGRQVVLITLGESALAAVLVGGGMLLLGQAWQPALLLGVISMATAPASTLMVVRESDSAGPLTETLLGIIAVNNLLCMTAYALAAAVIDLTSGQQQGGFAEALYASGFWLLWQLLGSAALGYLAGLLLASWSTRVEEGGEMLILLAGAILLCVGASRALQLSPLIASIAVGATIANLTRHSDRLFETLAGTDPPFYAVFFVLAGAELDVRRIPEMGALGFAYVLGRTSGKFLGARLVAVRLRLESAVQHYLGFALLAQAGLAVGLTLAVNNRYQEFAPTISTIVLASVAVFEVVGPSSARFALSRAGEVGRARQMQPRL